MNKGGRRVLVVDDVATALRYEGFEVEEAADGEEALQAVARREPDMIVLDSLLPRLNGDEVHRRLRGSGYAKGVLFLTAEDAGRAADEARAGAVGYMAKPFSLAELVARVETMLDT
jgi:DNA-binding response OmpR family regulator